MPAYFLRMLRAGHHFTNLMLISTSCHPAQHQSTDANQETSPTGPHAVFIHRLTVEERDAHNP